MSSITLGADIELVAQQDNKPFSVVGLIGGSKEKPLPVAGGNLQEDNVLAEYAIDPVRTEDEWVQSILSVQDQLRLKLGTLELAAMPSARFPDDQLVTKQAKTFGCEPDMNAWEMMLNPAPDVDAVGNLRTCGGHIHVGFEAQDDIDRAMLIHWMEIYLGLPSVLLDPDRDRRGVYGKAGSCRFKPYGVEYRTLSNFWTTDAGLIRWAYNQTHKAYQRHTQEAVTDLLDFDQCQAIQDAINTGDVDQAKAFMDMMEVEYDDVG